jgi:hypothetical protein
VGLTIASAGIHIVDVPMLEGLEANLLKAIAALALMSALTIVPSSISDELNGTSVGFLPI